MALGSPRVVYVVALEAAPVIGTRDVVLEVSRSSVSIISVKRFALVAFLASVPEVEVQKGTF